MIKSGEIYRHYKGHIYKVIGLARHSESLEELVIYARVDNEADLWVRPSEMFAGVLADGRRRFELLESYQQK